MTIDITDKTVAASAAKQYFPVLTGVRAIAAYMVFLSHDNPFLGEGLGGLTQRYLAPFFGALSIGVSVFFVLSGFLIAVRYEQSIALNWQWARRYIRNRVARIYPMYFLVTIATLIGTTINAGYDPSRLWKFYNLKDKIWVVFLNLTFLRGFFDRYRFTMAGQGWSLTVEECFYLSAPFLLLGLRRDWRRLFFYPFLLLGVGLLLVAIGSTFHDQLFGFFGSVRFMLDWTFFGRCLEFLAGMGLALYIRHKPGTQKKGFLLTGVGISWMALCMALLAYAERNTPTDIAVMHMLNPISYVVRNAILPVGIVILFWGLLYEQNWMKRLLETPFFDLLGKSSYSFYLIHVGILDFFLNDFVTHSILGKFVIINLVAIALYKFVEHPMHRLLTSRR
ncbi:acyltransferase family protein [Hymenobacter aerophilus]|uniref:acyltransferase family protein n=1 Tax=Hymenobacter aerophilus TaxID=119644 RepID=UPI000382EF6B|nr:acyltransferase [Hymenobacter aerophilus]